MGLSFTCGGNGGDVSAETTGDTTGESTGMLSDTKTTGDAPTSTVGTEATGTGDPTAAEATGPATTLGDATSSGSDGDTTSSEETGLVTTSTGDSSTGEDVAGASVDDACGPDDGPALEFRLGTDEPVCGSPWSAGQLRIVLYTGGPLVPGEFSLEPGTATVTFDDGSGAVFGTMGTLTITSWSEQLVTGSYDVTLADATVHTGSFAGPHCLTMPACA